MKAVAPPTSTGLRAIAPPTAAKASPSGVPSLSSSSGNLLDLPIVPLVVLQLDDGRFVGKRAAARSGDRQADRHDGAFARRALDHHRALVQRDQALDQRQAEPGAFIFARIVVAQLRERLAEPAEILFGDADAGVVDPEMHPRA